MNIFKLVLVLLLLATPIAAEQPRETLGLTRHQLFRLEKQTTQHVTRRIVEQYLFHLGALDTRADAHAVDRASRYFQSHPHELAMILAILNKLHLYDGIVDYVDD